MKFTKSLITKVLLGEALKYKRMATGKVPFKNTMLSDSHIQQIIKLVHDHTGISVDEIEKKILDEVKEKEEIKKYSPLLYDTLVKNAVESAAFALLKHVVDSPEIESQREVFSNKTWDKLISLIEKEHKSFFKLHSPGRWNYHEHIDWILLPSSDKIENAKYQSVDTAAVTPKGKFLFYKPFLQQLLDFAVIEKPKITNSKYQSNGGPIPDAYVYVEWVILHELLHYTHGDFDNALRLPKYSHKVHNIASDLRSNYRLVSSGYGQLPVGLYSDHINYDRQQTYRELCDIVQKELDKIPQSLQKHVQTLDDHEPQSNKKQAKVGDVVRLPNGGYAQVTTVDTDGSFDVKDISSQEASKIVGRQLQERRQSSIINEARWKPHEVTFISPLDKRSGDDPPGDFPGGDTADENTDDIQKEIDKKWKKREEYEPEKPSDDSNTPKIRSAATAGNIQTPTSIADLLKDRKPAVNWRTLINQMIMGKIARPEQTWLKQHRRSVSYSSLAQQDEPVPIKPGERKLDQRVLKIAFVLDTSGSMSGIYPQVLVEVQNLIKQLGKVDQPIAVCMFASDSVWYEVNLGKNTWWQISDVSQLGKKPETGQISKDWKTLLSMGSTGGTNFDNKITGNLMNLAASGYNIMIFTDEGILEVQSNWNNFMNLFSQHKEQIFYVVDSVATWRASCERKANTKGQDGSIPSRWTSLDKR
jgi:hypothetical protein